MDFKEYLSNSSASPKKVLKIVLSISVVLLMMWLFMISRMEFNDRSRTADPATIERADSIRAAISGDRRSGMESAGERRPNIFMSAFTTFIIMLVIFGLMWFFTRKKGSDVTANKLTEIGRHTLGQGAHLKIVMINDEVWVLGVTSNNVQLLHRYDKKDWKEQIDFPKSDDRSFSDFFKGLT